MHLQSMKERGVGGLLGRGFECPNLGFYLGGNREPAETGRVDGMIRVSLNPNSSSQQPCKVGTVTISLLEQRYSVRLREVK